MKKPIKIAIALTIAIAFTSCEKETVGLDGNVLESEDKNPTGIIESATLINTIPATKAYQDAKEWAEKNSLTETWPENPAEEINVLGSLLDRADISYNQELINKLSPKARIWRINYWTEGGYCKGPNKEGKYDKKEKILLSADICYLVNDDNEDVLELESISLFNSTFNVAEGDLAITKDIVLPLRALHNTLVVFPWYQGTMVDRGEHAVAPQEFLIKAQQAIDAELAAIEFINSIKETEKISLAEDYYTENMGVSNGGGTTLAIQYLLEKDKDYIKYNNEKIHLAASYIGEGCQSYTNLFKQIVDDAFDTEREFDPDASVEHVRPGAYLGAIVGSWYTYKLDPKKKNSDNQKEYYDYQREYANMLELFDESFINTQYTNTNWKYEDQQTPSANMIEAAVNGKLYEGVYGDFDGITIKDMIPDERTEEYNKSYNEIIKKLEESDKILLSNWGPQTPILFRHSTDDEFIPYESEILPMYNTLSNNGVNRNVSVGTISGLQHIYSSVYLTIVDICLKKHPCPINNTKKYLNK